MVESQTTIRVRDLEHNIQEISSDLMARRAADAEKRSIERKKKKYLDFKKQGEAAKKRIKFYDKKGSGYMKDGKKIYD